MVSVDPEDVAAASNVHVSPETYRASTSKTTPAELGFNPEDITNPALKWPSTTTDRFTWAEVPVAG